MNSNAWVVTDLDSAAVEARRALRLLGTADIIMLSRPAEAAAKLQSSRPDVIVVDLLRPLEDVAAVVRTLRHSFPDPPILVVADNPADPRLGDVLDAGASCIVMREDASSTLADRAISAGAARDGSSAAAFHELAGVAS